MGGWVRSLPLSPKVLEEITPGPVKGSTLEDRKAFYTEVIHSIYEMFIDNPYYTNMLKSWLAKGYRFVERWNGVENTLSSDALTAGYKKTAEEYHRESLNSERKLSEPYLIIGSPHKVFEEIQKDYRFIMGIVYKNTGKLWKDLSKSVKGGLAETVTRRIKNLSTRSKSLYLYNILKKLKEEQVLTAVSSEDLKSLFALWNKEYKQSKALGPTPALKIADSLSQIKTTTSPNLQKAYDLLERNGLGGLGTALKDLSTIDQGLMDTVAELEGATPLPDILTNDPLFPPEPEEEPTGVWGRNSLRDTSPGGRKEDD